MNSILGLLIIIWSSMYSLLSFDNCLGGSFIEENLDPEPPIKIIVEMNFFLSIIEYLS